MKEQNTPLIKTRISLILLVVLLSGGCRAIEPSALATFTQAAQRSPVPPSPTGTLTPTFIPTPKATEAPFPTLSPVDAAGRIAELLGSNAGCELPCWWGIVPGETSWDSAQRFLAPFASRIGKGESLTYTKDGKDYLTGSVGVQFKVPGHSVLGLINFSVVNGVVDVIWVLPRGTEMRYQASQFLKTFGRFEKAWMAVDADYDLFQLLLYYPDKGITALYEGPAVKNDSDYKLCLEGVGPELWLWSPGKVFMPDKNRFIGPDFGLGPGGHEKHLRTIEAAGLSPEAIVENFGNTGPGCITTPRNLWEVP